MRNILSQIATAALAMLLASGCSVLPRAHPVPAEKPAAAPQAAATPPPVPTPAPIRPRRPAKEARETREPEKVAAVDPRSLIGLQPAAVEKLLGSPSAVAKAAPSLVWTYSGPGCTFQIVFYPDLKTASYHALKYASAPAGPGADSADNACLRNILTVRSNGPS